jgi:hypothetical protein
MWRTVGAATRVGIGDAIDAASASQSLFDEALFSSAGVDSQYWRQSLMAQARAGIDSYISRKHNGMTLSERVYRNGVLSSGALDKAINNGLLLGKSAREIAADVARYINPSTPGGVSYAAMRLARTELNNAFHTTQISQMKDAPWVESATWNLSGSHPKPDECNEYAETVHFDGGGPGQYLVEDVPSKPHPHCLCFITPNTVSDEEFLRRFKDGQYDDHINSMGCMAIA